MHIPTSVTQGIPVNAWLKFFSNKLVKIFDRAGCIISMQP